MDLPFGRGRRARRELQEQLASIFSRLDALETEPVSRGMKLEIEKHVAIQYGEIMARLDAVGVDCDTVTGKLREMTHAVSEGIERTDRSERRIHATIKRARKELQAHGFEDPGLEAEAHELRLLDGGGGTDSGLPEVQPTLDPSAAEASSIRGVSAETLRRARGS